jgi:hypothetical protein
MVLSLPVNFLPVNFLPAKFPPVNCHYPSIVFRFSVVWCYQALVPSQNWC